MKATVSNTLNEFQGCGLPPAKRLSYTGADTAAATRTARAARAVVTAVRQPILNDTVERAVLDQCACRAQICESCLANLRLSRPDRQFTRHYKRSQIWEVSYVVRSHLQEHGQQHGRQHEQLCFEVNKYPNKAFTPTLFDISTIGARAGSAAA